MVRVPGASGASGFHREAQDDVKVKEQSREEFLKKSLEFLFPLKAAVAVDPDSRQDPLTKQTKVKAEPYSFIDPDKPTLYMPKYTQVSRS
ncbi:hypothetical protein PHMEG_00036896 [Phytophthora megakarya]|uniref:Uncharacterized protein n=1 Tax=Phytophthora megakarya TaxID=4795 RepID=A0A225UM78_9STRA|nr:hypothetical protein PHMEG_00036896 [Phytophthora megakarya]